jgi:hypothetical protein
MGNSQMIESEISVEDISEAYEDLWSVWGHS